MKGLLQLRRRRTVNIKQRHNLVKQRLVTLTGVYEPLLPHQLGHIIQRKHNLLDLHPSVSVHKASLVPMILKRFLGNKAKKGQHFGYRRQLLET